MKDRRGSTSRPLQPQPMLCIYGLFSFVAPLKRQHQGGGCGGRGGWGGHTQSSLAFPESSLVNTGTNVLEGEHLNGSCQYQRPAWRGPSSNSGSPGNNTAGDNGIGGSLRVQITALAHREHNEALSRWGPGWDRMASAWEMKAVECGGQILPMVLEACKLMENPWFPPTACLELFDSCLLSRTTLHCRPVTKPLLKKKKK